jgi:hypothetical protein
VGRLRSRMVVPLSRTLISSSGFPTLLHTCSHCASKRLRTRSPSAWKQRKRGTSRLSGLWKDRKRQGRGGSISVRTHTSSALADEVSRLSRSLVRKDSRSVHTAGTAQGNRECAARARIRYSACALELAHSGGSVVQAGPFTGCRLSQEYL